MPGLAFYALVKYKGLYERPAFNVKLERLSTFALNASRSYDLLYFTHASKASQIHVRNRSKIYATVEIHPWCSVSNCLLLPVVANNNWQKEKKNNNKLKKNLRF